MSLNKVFNEANAKRNKLQSQFFSQQLQTNLVFQDELGTNNGAISTEIASNNRNNLYYLNEAGVLFPVNNSSQRFYEQCVPSVTIGTADGEKSIFDDTDAIGRLDILPNITRIGSKFHLKSHGTIVSTPNSQFILKTKLGTAIIEQQTITIPNVDDGFFELDMELRVKTIGNSGEASIYTFGKIIFTKTNGTAVTFFINDVNNTTYQTTELAIADVTIEWISLNGNTFDIQAVSVDMLN